MSDALVSPTVAAACAALSVGLIAIAVSKIRKSDDQNSLPIMGVMGAFVFATQMINFTIPGTGSSGHIVGGVLLAAILGPWAALITLSAVLLLQALMFADGGLIALGCNILNMGVFSCLVAYPLIYRPIAADSTSFGRIATASIICSIIALELGSAAVVLETEASSITALPTSTFLSFMLPIHIFIGLGEGLATAALLYFISSRRPEMLYSIRLRELKTNNRPRLSGILTIITLLALIIGGLLAWIASSYPDGLEWSILNVSGSTELPSGSSSAHTVAKSIQDSISIMPDYNSYLSGIIGSLILIIIAFLTAYFIRLHRPKA